MPTRIRFHLDEHIFPAIATGLRQRGIDVTTSKDTGLDGASDEQHIVYALREGRVIVTHDSDFPRFHASGLPHAGIVYCYQSKYRIGEFIRKLLMLYECLSAEDLFGKLEFL